MLWHKAWLETRWRFLIGLALMSVVACGVLIDYRATARLIPLVRGIDASALDARGPIGAAIKESFEIQVHEGFRGFVWLQWYRQNFSNLVTLFAALLGAGLISRPSGGATAFTLSLPVTRGELVTTRSLVGLAELLVLVLVPSLVILLASPAIGESYSIVDVAVHGVCAFAAGAVFFGLAALLSTEFGDIWRPVLITCLVAVVLGILEFVPAFAPYGLFRVMSATTYFRDGTLPWVGLLLCALVSAALLRTAAASLAGRDF
jgi:hypothetical protein